MVINYHNRFFRTVVNDAAGDLDGFTLFHYRQEGHRVWAEYSGGPILQGLQLASMDEDGVLTMAYHHMTRSGEIKAGQCVSRPEILPDGRMRLYESWSLDTGGGGKGTSVIEEVIQPGRFQNLEKLPGTYAVCRLAGNPDPAQLLRDREFYSLTRTDEEISFLCPDQDLPDNAVIETDWVGLKVSGILSFSQIGILSSLTQPLAEGGVSVIAVSTFNTDYLFVKEWDYSRAKDLLEKEGHKITGRSKA